MAATKKWLIQKTTLDLLAQTTERALRALPWDAPRDAVIELLVLQRMLVYPPLYQSGADYTRERQRQALAYDQAHGLAPQEEPHA